MVQVRTATLTQSDGAALSLTTDPPRGGETRWFVEDVAGWYGGSGVRSESTAKLGHGTFHSRGYREGRTLTVHGWVECENADLRDWHERNLSGLMWDGKWGTLTCFDGVDTLTTRVRLDGAPQIVNIGVTTLQFNIPLVSESAFLYGEWRESNLRPAYAGVGFDFPPLSEDRGHGQIITFGEGLASDDLIWNDGNADAWPQFEVHGNFPGGIAVSVDGRELSYPWPIYPGTPVVFDESGALRIGGVDQSHLLAKRDWASVAPKSISRVAMHPLRGGTGWASAWHRDTYI